MNIRRPDDHTELGLRVFSSDLRAGAQLLRMEERDAPRLFDAFSSFSAVWLVLGTNLGIVFYSVFILFSPYTEDICQKAQKHMIFYEPQTLPLIQNGAY
jgi:hypothetical protein